MKPAVGAAPVPRPDAPRVGKLTDAAIALSPVVAMAALNYGLRALVMTLLSVLSCVVLEFFAEKLRRKRTPGALLSALVTGVVLAMNLPACAPLWVPLVGAAVAILLAKEAFGGSGCNLFNPALTGVVFLTVCWPDILSLFQLPLRGFSSLTVSPAFTTTQTVLSSLRAGRLPQAGYRDLLWGVHPAAMGTGAAAVLLLAGLYLIVRRACSVSLPAAFLGTIAVLSLLFPRLPGGGRVGSMLYELGSGAVLFSAFFLLADPVTTPKTAPGRALYGVLCGALTVLLRDLGTEPEGAYFALLLMNPLALPLDRLAARLPGRAKPAAGGKPARPAERSARRPGAGLSARPKPGQVLLDGALRRNPVWARALALAPVLAVSATLRGGILLAAVTLLLLTAMGLCSGLLARRIPDVVRAAALTALAALLLTPLLLFGRKLDPQGAAAAGVFLPLAAVNGVILARAKTFSRRAGALLSMMDGAANGVGFALLLVPLSALRELFGLGTLGGRPVAALNGFVLPALSGPAGGFLLLGLVCAGARALFLQNQRPAASGRSPAPGGDGSPGRLRAPAGFPVQPNGPTHETPASNGKESRR